MNYHVATFHNKLEWLNLLTTNRALLCQNHVFKQYWGKLSLLLPTLSIDYLPTLLILEVLWKPSPNFTQKSMSQTIYSLRYLDVSHLLIFIHERGKLDPRVSKYLFVGYSSSQKGYKCYYPFIKKFYVSANATLLRQNPT